MTVRYTWRKRVGWMCTAALLLVVCLGASLVTAAPDTLEEKLDAHLDRYQRVISLPGVAVAIMHEGEMVYTGVRGEGVDEDTSFYIGSISKSFTGLAVMQLVEQGLLELDRPVSAYIPEFTVSDEIQVRHLLHHVSGMTEADFMSKLPPTATAAELVTALNRVTPSHPPGEVFSYFNPNYSLLGYIIERISGQDYAEYITEHIFTPLELTRTSTGGDVDVPGHRSFFGYSWEWDETFIQYDLPAGYITGSVNDLVHFLEAVRTRDPALGVSPEGVDRMVEPGEVVPYGMGWMIGDYEGRPAVHHGGSLPGYVADGIILTEDGYSIAVLVNKNHLVHAVIFFPDMVNGIVTILNGDAHLDRLIAYQIYRLFIVLFVISLLSHLFKVLKLLFWPKPMSRVRRAGSVLINVLIPVAIFIAVPLVSKAVLQRGFTWELGYLLVPDFISWMVLGIGFQLAEAVAHGIHYLIGTDTRRFAKY